MENYVALIKSILKTNVQFVKSFINTNRSVLGRVDRCQTHSERTINVYNKNYDCVMAKLAREPQVAKDLEMGKKNLFQCL